MNGSTVFNCNFVNAFMTQQNDSRSRPTFVLIVPLLIKYVCYNVKLKQNAFPTTTVPKLLARKKIWPQILETNVQKYTIYTNALKL